MGTQLASLLAECWLMSARAAREARLLETAYSAVLQAEAQLPASLASEPAAGLALERAQLRWARGEHHDALMRLRADLEVLQPAKGAAIEQGALLVADWMAETSRYDADDVLKQYDSVVRQANWDRGYHALARYLDQLVSAGHYKEDHLPTIVKNYGQSLIYGSTHTFQALPRLLTLWLEYGDRLPTPGFGTDMGAGGGSSSTSSAAAGGADQRKARSTILEKMNRELSDLHGAIPVYQFLAALPHLTSRILHRNREVVGILKSILCRLLLTYPQQTMWMMIVLKKSTFLPRRDRCKEILAQAVTQVSREGGGGREEGIAGLTSKRKGTQDQDEENGVPWQEKKMLCVNFICLPTYLPLRQNKSLEALFHRFTSLGDHLLQVCDLDVAANVWTLETLKHFPEMIKEAPYDIIVPTSEAMVARLPTRPSDLQNHKPFPDNLPTIAGFGETVTLLSSLQRPRKVSMLGSNMRRYVFLCKPDDDMRKDTRIMDFNSMINKLLQADGEARQRQLRIRTYAVVPLNEKCGIIEWVCERTGDAQRRQKEWNGFLAAFCAFVQCHLCTLQSTLLASKVSFNLFIATLLALPLSFLGSKHPCLSRYCA